MFLPLLLAGQEVPDRVTAAMAEYRSRTRADPGCVAPGDPDEITVCAQRRADQWRVPLIEYDAGDPRHEGVPAERERYLRVRTPCEEHGPFLAGCGAAGVTMTMEFGGPGAAPPKVRGRVP